MGARSNHVEGVQRLGMFRVGFEREGSEGVRDLRD